MKFLPKLEAAAEKYPNVFISTHFPLWVEACFQPNGTLSCMHDEGQNWMPWSLNIELGMKVLALAEDYPNVQFQCITGHTHGYGEADILPNLKTYSHEVKRYGQTPKTKIWDLK